MEDDFGEMENLMDDDPALDYILYEDMEQKGRQNGGGCLGLVVILILPLTASCCGLLIRCV